MADPYAYFRIKYPGLKPKDHSSFIRVEATSVNAEWDEMCEESRSYPFIVFDGLTGKTGDHVQVNMYFLRRVRGEEARALEEQWDTAVAYHPDSKDEQNAAAPAP